MAKSASEQELAERASFIFRGTVSKLKAAAAAGVPVTDKTAVVRVEEILRGPEAFAQFAGSEITVQLGRREKVGEGERAVFYTNSWLLGEGLAVQSVGHAPAPERAAASAAVGGETDRRLSEQVSSASTVVTGRVISVRLSEDDAARGSAGKPERISEHGPVWQEALIEVSDVEKGGGTPGQIVVRFPASTDVRWYGAPKFRPGQEGVFLLQRERKRKGARAASAGETAGAEVYTALDSESFQPLQRIESIRSLIKSSGK